MPPSAGDAVQQQQVAQVRAVRGPAGEFGAHGVVELSVPAQRAFHFMRRIEDQPRWNTGVKLSQIIERVTAHTTHVKQVLRWSFLSFRGNFDMRLAMVEEPEKLKIQTEMLQGSMMRRFSSSIGVQRLGPNSCQLEMHMFMQPAIFLPPGMGPLVSSQVCSQLQGVLGKVKNSVEEEEQQRQQAKRPGALALPPLGLESIKAALLVHPLDVSVWG